MEGRRRHRLNSRTGPTASVSPALGGKTNEYVRKSCLKRLSACYNRLVGNIWSADLKGKKAAPTKDVVEPEEAEAGTVGKMVSPTTETSVGTARTLDIGYVNA